MGLRKLLKQKFAKKPSKECKRHRRERSNDSGFETQVDACTLKAPEDDQNCAWISTESRSCIKTLVAESLSSNPTEKSTNCEPASVSNNRQTALPLSMVQTMPPPGLGIQSCLSLNKESSLDTQLERITKRRRFSKVITLSFNPDPVPTISKPPFANKVNPQRLLTPRFQSRVTHWISDDFSATETKTSVRYPAYSWPVENSDRPLHPSQAQVEPQSFTGFRIPSTTRIMRCPSSASTAMSDTPSDDAVSFAPSFAPSLVPSMAPSGAPSLVSSLATSFNSSMCSLATSVAPSMAPSIASSSRSVGGYRQWNHSTLPMQTVPRSRPRFRANSVVSAHAVAKHRDPIMPPNLDLCNPNTFSESSTMSGSYPSIRSRHSSIGKRTPLRNSRMIPLSLPFN